MNRKKKFEEKLNNVVVGWQVIAIAILAVIVPPLVIILIALYGFYDIYEKFGYLIACAVVEAFLLIRYFIRKLICKIKKDPEFFSKKHSLMEIMPSFAAFGIIAALIIALVIFVVGDQFWAGIIGFFGCFIFAAKSFDPDKEPE